MMWARFPRSNLFWFSFSALLMWLWLPLWFADQVPAFRDGFHFYLPQLVWLNGCYQQGEFFPIWNPNEGLGSSVAGQPSWQLFYPLRLIWLTPWLSLPQQMAVFFGVHQIIAAAGILKATRALKLSYCSSWLAAVCFSLSGPVVFQHTNMIYLCSAAWVGWALAPLLHLLKLYSEDNRENFALNTFRQLAGFTCACCLMFLGGDPHGAVNATVIAFLAVIFILFSKLRRKKISERVTDNAGPLSCSRAPNDEGRPSGVETINGGRSQGTSSPLAEIDPAQQLPCSNSYVSPLIRCYPDLLRILSGLFIGLLTLLQLMATWSWYQFSSRAPTHTEIVDFRHAAVTGILIDESPVVSPTFDFSLSPWSLPSLFWPTIGGHYQPNNTRWIAAVTSEGKMWVPSIYLGLLPTLLFIGTTAQSRSRFFSDHGWLLLVIAFTLLSSMGSYSAGWLLKEMGTFLGLKTWETLLPKDAELSLYGLLTHVIPGYDRFRYPAKWVIWTIAGIALFSATRFDAWIQQVPKKNLLSKPVLLVLVLSVVGLAILFSVSLVFPGPSEEIQLFLAQANDRLLGPVDPQTTVRSVAVALLWPIAILGTIVAGLMFPPSVRPCTLVVVTAVELAICNQSHWIVTTAMPKISTNSASGRSDAFLWANARQARFQDFSEIIQGDQLTLQLRLSQTFFLGKLNHLDGVAALNASGSLQPASVAKLIRWLQKNDDLSKQQPELDLLLSYLGVTHRLVRQRSAPFLWQPVPDSQPLCEFILEPNPTNSQTENPPYSIRWRWENNQTLILSVETSDSGYLIIRQANDGGWLLQKTPPNRDSSMTFAQNELFLVTRLQAGKHQLKLSRRNSLWLWN